MGNKSNNFLLESATPRRGVIKIQDLADGTSRHPLLRMDIQGHPAEDILDIHIQDILDILDILDIQDILSGHQTCSI
jgi:hypothetical protein